MRETKNKTVLYTVGEPHMSSSISSALTTLTNGLTNLLSAIINFIAYAIQSIANVLSNFASPLGNLVGVIVVIGAVLSLVLGFFGRGRIFGGLFSPLKRLFGGTMGGY